MERGDRRRLRRWFWCACCRAERAAKKKAPIARGRWLTNLIRLAYFFFFAAAFLAGAFLAAFLVAFFID